MSKAAIYIKNEGQLADILKVRRSSFCFSVRAILDPHAVYVQTQSSTPFFLGTILAVIPQLFRPRYLRLQSLRGFASRAWSDRLVMLPLDASCMLCTCRLFQICSRAIGRMWSSSSEAYDVSELSLSR
jgi:hypothetical protein